MFGAALMWSLVVFIVAIVQTLIMGIVGCGPDLEMDDV